MVREMGGIRRRWTKVVRLHEGAILREVVGNKSDGKERGWMVREKGRDRRHWTQIDQLTDFAGGISGGKWSVKIRKLTREDRRRRTNADSEQ